MSQEVIIDCPTCGESRCARVGQSFIGARLEWYQSVDCSNCGRSEYDGFGFPPANLRARLVKFQGAFRLLSSSEHKMAIVKVLRQALEVEQREIPAKFKDLPVIFTGTRTECDWLLTLLKEAGGNGYIDAVSPSAGSEV